MEFNVKQNGQMEMIVLVLVVVGAGPLWALTAQPSGPAVRVKETSFSRLALTDLLFTQDVLLEGRAMSRVDCSKKCVDTRGCVMTTFHPSPQGPPHHCRLYSTLHQATDPSRHVAGADSFAVTGLREMSSDDRNQKDEQEREDEQERGGGAGTRRRSRNEEEEQERGGTKMTSRNEDEQEERRG
ncbi:hypothetical protein ACOMHN_050189 [Nucella lapillus]